MKILGITAEYNPLHNGHIYQLNKAKSITRANYSIICMSGNFVQRGQAAILDKWTRAQMALESEGNADLVIELPFLFACNRAIHFARGAVGILAGLGATHISFGCESENFDAITRIAECSLKQETELEQLISEHMKKGVSRAKANETAMCEILESDVSDIIKSPNNILAIEYTKAILELKKSGKTIETVPIKRIGGGLNEADDALGIAGATKLRELISEDRLSEMENYVPKQVYKILSIRDEGEAGSNGPDERLSSRIEKAHKKAFEIIQSEIIRKPAQELAEIYSIGEGLENKLKKEVPKAKNIDELVDLLTSRRYTAATIRRILVYILLGIKTEVADELVKGTDSDCLYARVLAAGARGREYLRILKNDETYKMPLITNINKSIDYLPEVKQKVLLDTDVLAADMYNIIFDRDISAYSDKVIRPFILDR